MYFEQAGGALFKDLERYGIRPPKYVEQTTVGKQHISHQAWSIFYQHSQATNFHTWIPSDTELDWMSAKYPDSFDRIYRPRYQYWRDQQVKGERFYNQNLPMLCQVCQLSLSFTEPDDDTRLSHRSLIHQGERFHFCSDGCHDIFRHEPEKYLQARLPVHEILKGNCGGSNVEEVVRDYYHITSSEESFEYLGSPEHRRWQQWKNDEPKPDGDLPKVI